MVKTRQNAHLQIPQEIQDELSMVIKQFAIVDASSPDQKFVSDNLYRIVAICREMCVRRIPDHLVVKYICSTDLMLTVMRLMNSLISSPVYLIFEDTIVETVLDLIGFLISTSHEGAFNVIQAGCLFFLKDVIDIVVMIEEKDRIESMRVYAIHLVGVLAADCASVCTLCRQLGFVKQIGDLIRSGNTDVRNLNNSISVIDSLFQTDSDCEIGVFKEFVEISSFLLKNSKDNSILVEVASLLAHLSNGPALHIAIILDEGIFSLALNLLKLPDDSFSNVMRVRLLKFVLSVLGHDKLITQEISDEATLFSEELLFHFSPVVRNDVTLCFMRIITLNKKNLKYIHSLIDNGLFSQFVTSLASEEDQFARSGFLGIVLALLRRCDAEQIKFVSSMSVVDSLCLSVHPKRRQSDKLLGYEGLSILLGLDDPDFNKHICQLIDKSGAVEWVVNFEYVDHFANNNHVLNQLKANGYV